MPAKSFTDKFIENVRLPEKPRQDMYIHTLKRGCALQLIVSYGGTRTFRALRYVNGGKAKSIKLGVYHPRGKEAGAGYLTLKQAFDAAESYWKDPTTLEGRTNSGSFKAVAEEWVKRHVIANGLRSRKEIERKLRVYVYPRWQDRPFVDIRRRDITELLDGIVDNHGRRQADAVLAVLRSIMNWYAARGDDYNSPIVKGMKRGQYVARKRTLTEDEIRKLWRCTSDMGHFGGLMRMLLLTGQRLSKVAEMRWDDLKGDVWTVRCGFR